MRFVAVPTRWLTESDDLVDVLRDHLPELGSDDVVIVSEKVAVLLSGRAERIEKYAPRFVARLLVRFVHPPPGSRGLAVPEKMQFVVEHLGVVRVLVAALVSAATRPFGVRGMFYRIAGPVARDLDGGRPPYEHLLLPPLSPQAATELCARLERATSTAVAIVDLNDFGGRVRATSARCPDARVLLELIGHNPLGQRLTSTPFGVLYRGSAAPDSSRERLA